MSDDTTDVYLDNHATTRTDPRVVEAMLPFFTEHFGNAASSSHSFGRDAADAVEMARAEVAQLVGSTATRNYLHQRSDRSQ